MLFIAVGISLKVNAQESPGPMSVNMDLVSGFVWRGSKLGNGPAVQPTMEFSVGGFTLGAWGSYCFSDAEATETDLYTSLTLGNFTLGLTDYYYPGTTWFKAANHAFEVNGSLSFGNFSFSANYILNEGAGSSGRDLYMEAGLTAGRVNLFAGGGSGWHTSNGNFNLCNIGLSSVREIKITDSFSLPLSGSLILNPETGQLYLVAGITL